MLVPCHQAVVLRYLRLSASPMVQQMEAQSNQIQEETPPRGLQVELSVPRLRSLPKFVGVPHEKMMMLLRRQYVKPPMIELVKEITIALLSTLICYKFSSFLVVFATIPCASLGVLGRSN